MDSSQPLRPTNALFRHYLELWSGWSAAAMPKQSIQSGTESSINRFVLN